MLLYSGPAQTTSTASAQHRQCLQGNHVVIVGAEPIPQPWYPEYTTAVSSVSSTDSASYSGKKLCCYTQGTPSQAQPQTMVVGQSPASDTWLLKFCCRLGYPSLSPRPSLRPWLLGSIHSSISLQHRQCLSGKKLCCNTQVASGGRASELCEYTTTILSGLR